MTFEEVRQTRAKLRVLKRAKREGYAVDEKIAELDAKLSRHYRELRERVG